jgi:hypothetical protein
MTKRYFISAFWGSRVEEPDQLAVRFLKHIDLLRDISPLFALWISGAKGPRKLEDIRAHFAKEIALRISKDDFGEVEPERGYGFGAYTRGQPESLSYTINVGAGSHTGYPYENYVGFGNSSFMNAVPDPAAITYQIFKSALLALVEAWEPSDCYASSHDLLDLLPRPGLHEHFREAWMQYVSAPLARLITPPSTTINEWLPNGGLLMSATNETFKVDNPAHLAAARDIAAATAPLNA